MTTTTGTVNSYDPAAFAAGLERLHQQLDENRRMLDDVGRTLARLTALCLAGRDGGDDEADEALTDVQQWARGKFPPQWQAAMEDVEAERIAAQFAASAAREDGDAFDVAGAVPPPPPR